MMRLSTGNSEATFFKAILEGQDVEMLEDAWIDISSAEGLRKAADTIESMETMGWRWYINEDIREIRFYRKLNITSEMREKAREYFIQYGVESDV